MTHQTNFSNSVHKILAVFSAITENETASTTAHNLLTKIPWMQGSKIAARVSRQWSNLSNHYTDDDDDESDKRI